MRKVKHTSHNNNNAASPDNKEEAEALNALVSLLQENADSESDLEPSTYTLECPQASNIIIRSVKMPPLSKHKWICLFLDQVQKDLVKINWNWRGIDNLTKEERMALKELKESTNLVIKGSDKGGNIVLLSENHHEQETMRQLSDVTTY